MDLAGWRAVFLINVPIAALVLGLTLLAAGAAGGLLNAVRQAGATLGVAAMGGVMGLGEASGPATAMAPAAAVCAAAGVWFASAAPSQN